jgi:hypothetical protein
MRCIYKQANFAASSQEQSDRIRHAPGNRKAPSSFFFVDIISTAVQPLPLRLAARMEKQTIAACPRWWSRTAVSAYQSVLVALAAADNVALLLDEHLVAAAAAIEWDELADKGRVLSGRAIDEAPQLAGLILSCWTSSAPPTRQPGAWSPRRSTEPPAEHRA